MSTKNKLSRIACAIGATTLLGASLLSGVASAAEDPLAGAAGLPLPPDRPDHAGQAPSESLKAVSGGDIQLRYYEPGELVPPFEIMDAVSSGKYPAGYTWIGYDQGTIPALPLYSGAVQHGAAGAPGLVLPG